MCDGLFSIPERCICRNLNRKVILVVSEWTFAQGLFPRVVVEAHSLNSTWSCFASGDESFIRIRDVIFRRFRPDDVRRDDNQAAEERAVLQAWLDQQSLQSRVRYIHAGVGSRPDKPANRYDERHVPANTGKWGAN